MFGPSDPATTRKSVSPESALPTAPNRPRLNPALRPLWRDESTLQLGLDPDLALVIHDVDPDTRALLAALDGQRSEPELVTEAAARGQDLADVRTLLAGLRQANVLTDPTSSGLALLRGPAEADRLAPDLASLSLLDQTGTAGADRRLRLRTGAQVVVHSANRVGVPLAAAIAAAGVGRVSVVDRGTTTLADAAPGGLLPADEQRPRRLAAIDAVRRAAPRAGTDLDVDDRPDLVVLCDPWPDIEAMVGPLHAAGTAHLVATVRETTGVVGPLVRPGRSSCLRCADLHRADRDPAWPAMLAQLSPEQRRPNDPVDGPLALLVAAAAALQVLAHIDGGGQEGAAAAVQEASLELTLPDWRLRRRSWPPHSRCRCWDRSSARAG